MIFLHDVASSKIPSSSKSFSGTLDIREFSTTSWRSVIGVVPQDPILFTGTIASNIAFGSPDATREQIEDAAREANCEFIWGMPQGFDTESECLLVCMAPFINGVHSIELAGLV